MLADPNLDPKPRPKIAIQQSRPLAVLRAFIHLPALLGSITLVLLNCVTCFFAPATSNAPISVLQFAAKVHELLMQMSIAALALSYMRDQVGRHGHMPFSAFIPTLQTSSMNSLWSTEFRSALKSLGGRQRTMYVLLIAFCVFLAAAVGPSSAIAMIPRVVDFPSAEGVQIIPRKAYGEVFPTSLSAASLDPVCENNTWVNDPRSNCLSSDWQLVATNVRQLSEVGNNTLSGSQFELPTGEMGSTPVTRSLQLSSRHGSFSQFGSLQGDAYATTQSYMIAYSMSEATSYWYSKFGPDDPRYNTQLSIVASVQ
jgi:hypothetical protein